MADNDKTVKAETPEKTRAESVSQKRYDELVADNGKLRAAVDKLITAMAQRYAQDLYREVMGE